MQVKNGKATLSKAELIGLLNTVREIYPDLDAPVVDVETISFEAEHRPALRVELPNGRVAYTNVSADNWNGYWRLPRPATRTVFRYAVKTPDHAQWELFEQTFNNRDERYVVAVETSEEAVAAWVEAAPRLVSF